MYSMNCKRWVMSFMNWCTGLYDRQAVSLWSNFQRDRTQRKRCSRQGLKMSLTPQIFLFIRGEWCIVHPKFKTKEKTTEKYFIGLFHIFQIYIDDCRFQAFAVIWILYMFFWVFPRRQYVICRRFGTMYQFHVQRLEVDCVVWGKEGLIYRGWEWDWG